MSEGETRAAPVKTRSIGVGTKIAARVLQAADATCRNAVNTGEARYPRVYERMRSGEV